MILSNKIAPGSKQSKHRVAIKGWVLLKNLDSANSVAVWFLGVI